ncbi:hypothetical protein Taro_012516 [Colocasia esculenta]|uniref:Protein EARLY HEADING DATE 2 n=1 Tax=Colocasia esculenta TaxID=4460 RepID=A0A843U479_COLES|nr:hypothetical protein [Colocasia esculenta]
MLPTTTSNSTSISEEASVCSGSIRAHGYGGLNPLFPPISYYSKPPVKPKKTRNQPGNPDPDAEVVALSPGTLMATNRFVCEICGKGFQRDQNLQLHRRGHNLPWKLRQRSEQEAAERKKKVYVCPEESCVHHHPSRALGDLTGIKKHFSRKHGEKKWKCERCSKRYAVMSDWKAHARTCGTREYRCNCGTIFSRKDSFITHRAFCDALAEESARLNAAAAAAASAATFTPLHHHNPPQVHVKTEDPPTLFLHHHIPGRTTAAPHLSATALLQKAAAVGHLAGATAGTSCTSAYGANDGRHPCAWREDGCLLTRDFLGVAGGAPEELLSVAGGGLGFVVAPGTGSCDVSVPTAIPIAPTKPDTSVGFVFRYLPNAAATASGAWEGLLG